MSNGLPVSAVAGRRDMMALIENLVTGTFFDDPVSFRGAYEAMKLMKEENAPRMGGYSGRGVLGLDDGVRRPSCITVRCRGPFGVRTDSTRVCFT